jgi:hypothetical protein
LKNAIVKSKEENTTPVYDQKNVISDIEISYSNDKG